MRVRASWSVVVFSTIIAAPAASETLHNKDGVQMSATIRLIERGAATCRILEEKHTSEEYASLKLNDGKPLDVWRVDLEVANYSGKLVDHLIAHLQVRSEWPPCDNWDGPESSYGEPVRFTGPLMSLQRTGELTGLPPGEDARETLFVLAWHLDEPALGRWDINYSFAARHADAPLQDDRGVSGARSSSATAPGTSPDRAAIAVRREPPAPSPPASRPAGRSDLLDHMRRSSGRDPSVAGASRPSRRPGDVFSDPLSSGGQGPEMVVIPAGSFRMGCVSGVGCSDAERPVHSVTIPRAFAVAKYEVSFAEWDACVSAGGCSHRPGDNGWGRGRLPVMRVSWQDAGDYVGWLSEQTSAEYRLLSESEWEYAARAGSSTVYSWGNGIGSGRASCDGCGGQWDSRQTAPVGSFAANAFGLHDMHGNVWEWVQDCWNGSYSGAPSNGSAWISGDCSRRVLRGGSWLDLPWSLRSAYRFTNSTGLRDDNDGFRVARTLAP